MTTELSGSCACGAGAACAPLPLVPKGLAAAAARRSARTPPPCRACMSAADSVPAPVKGASSSSHEGRNIEAKRSASSGESRAWVNATGPFGEGSAGCAMIPTGSVTPEGPPHKRRVASRQSASAARDPADLLGEFGLQRVIPLVGDLPHGLQEVFELLVVEPREPAQRPAHDLVPVGVNRERSVGRGQE